MKITAKMKQYAACAALALAGCVSVTTYTGVWRERARAAVLDAKRDPQAADDCVSESLRATRDARKRGVAGLLPKQVAEAMNATVSRACEARVSTDGGTSVVDKDLGSGSDAAVKADQETADAGARG